jgi:hypothetical protein
MFENARKNAKSFKKSLRKDEKCEEYLKKTDKAKKMQIVFQEKCLKVEILGHHPVVLRLRIFWLITLCLWVSDSLLFQGTTSLGNSRKHLPSAISHKTRICSLKVLKLFSLLPSQTPLASEYPCKT